MCARVRNMLKNYSYCISYGPGVVLFIRNGYRHGYCMVQLLNSEIERIARYGNAQRQ